jgi:hypothetical protein
MNLLTRINNIEMIERKDTSSDNTDKLTNLTNLTPKSFKFDITSKKIGFITRNLLLTLLFGLIYIIVLRFNGNKMPAWKVMYFSLITQTTLGYDWMLPDKAIYYGINALHLILMWCMIIFEFVY